MHRGTPDVISNTLDEKKLRGLQLLRDGMGRTHGL